MLTEAQQLAPSLGPIQPSQQPGENTAFLPEQSSSAQRAGLTFERRATNRRPYVCAQLLAPYDGRTLPIQSEFRLVDCHDISPSGFSFDVESIPECQFVIIALGNAPFGFFSAEIVRTEQLDGHSEKNVRIGCRFLRRVGR